MKLSSRMLAILVAAASTVSLPAVPLATATPANDAVVINEAYGGGGNTGAPFTNDFIELYNPTDAPIDLGGYVLEYFSAKGTSGGKESLTGTIAPKGYFLAQMSGGANGVALPTADYVGKLAMSGTNGSVQLTKGATVVDTLGWGTATVKESTAAAATANPTSAQRVTPGVDTDNNSADFVVATPTPQNSGGAALEPTAPVQPGVIMPIADIQGTGATAPHVDQSVTTRGFVTSSYPEGGFNGFHIQTGGTGKTQKKSGDASDAIFVWTNSETGLPAVGTCVEVTGTVAEYGNAGTSVTQLKSPAIVEKQAADCGEAVVPVSIDTMPADAAVREAYEGMLVQPTGAHTVTNNYNLNKYGTVDLATGTKPYFQATDVFPPSTDPNSDVQKLMAQQAAEVVTLDDGRSGNYSTKDMNTPLPYLAQAGTIKSLRTGDGVTFQKPVIFDQRFNSWNYQPTAPLTGNTAGADLPITWTDSQPSVLNVPDTVAGEYSLASFNVLNYFTTLGQDVAGCTSYKDRFGTPVTVAFGCNVRGAYSASAFADQQAKIVAAINKLNVSVLGLEEIENTATVTGDVSRRDEALNNLVTELNKAGGNWAAVKSPAKVPSGEDAIRVAFIYNKDKVAPKGDSIIFDAPEFTGTARQPLAQEFTAVVNPEASFVAVINHFKSKGSVAHGDADMGDGQGNNANLRVEQAKALLRELGKQTQWKDAPTFILGDLNSYSKETAVTTIIDGGFTLIDGHSQSYQFSGRLGSLDHVLGNAAAMKLVKDAKVWDINSDESLAFEYSRRNYNAVDFYAPDVFRSSDHDPIKVGFDLPKAAPTTTPSPSPSPSPSPEPTPTVTTPATSEVPQPSNPSSSTAHSSKSRGFLGFFGFFVGIVSALGIGDYLLRTFMPQVYADLQNRFFALLGLFGRR
ncbi:ExeM/NucH family extracellular endonuclease [Staphylococcus chromogenes]|nr:ExeM/NucH family extracellular endonuclease [Staphylococcus chromogenes]